MPIKKNINNGDKFGRLTILRELSVGRFPSGFSYRRFECLCDCGNKRSFQLSRIISGHTTSCGCYKTEFLRNKKLSDETKKKISVNHSRHNLGKKFSVETRKKISIRVI